jgi:hypothetical protein
MRILGADSFVGKTTSINAIPVNVLKHHDLCIVKIEAGTVGFVPAVYFYEYTTNDGNNENIPYIIIPIDNSDGSDDGGRWKLKDIFVNSFHSGSVYTNNILSEVPGVPITIGDSFTVTTDGITVDGQVTINSALTDPPLIVNSKVMVENLNAEFVGNESVDSFIRSYNFDTAIPNGVMEFDVYFSHEVVNPPHYTVLIDICNTVDPNPSIYGFTVVRKEQEFFTIRFSGVIDSANYTLHYLVIGLISDTYVPPNITSGNSGVTWTTINSDEDVLAGFGYFVNTESQPIILTLPSDPSVGDRIEISDYSGSFSINNCIIMRNGGIIMSVAEDFVCDVDGMSMVMVYSGLTHGWRIIDYNIM